MKKLQSMLIVTLVTLSSFAQVGMHAGLNLGVNNTWILNQNNYGYSEMDYNLKFGANIGAALGYNFTDNAGVELELNYVSMGQNYFDKIRDFGPIGADGKRAKVDTYRYISLSYLQIPILFRYQTTRDSKQKIAFHGMIGPSIGLLLNADQYYEADQDANGSVEVLDYAYVPETAVSAFAATAEVEAPKDYFSGIDIGVQLDLGVDIYFTENVYLTPALKLYNGFSDMNADATRDTNSYSASHNGYGGISVGVHYFMPEKNKK